MLKGITPQETRGPGFAQKTNPGTGMSKGGGSNGHGGGDMGKVHERPSTSQGSEYSYVREDGTGLSK